MASVSVLAVLGAWQTGSILTVIAAVCSGLLSGAVSRFRFLPAPAVEIFAGLIFASILGWHPENDLTTAVSGVALFALMTSSGFEAGEEVLSNRLGAGSKLAIVGAFSAAGLGLVGSLTMGLSLRSSLLVAVSLAPTSVGIASRTFKELGLLNSKLASLTLSTAVVDDLVGISFLILVEAFLISSGLKHQLVALAASLAMPIVVVVGLKLRRSRPPRRGRSGKIRRTPIFLVALVALVSILGSGSLVVVGFFFGTALVTFSDDRDPVVPRQAWSLAAVIVPAFFFLAGTGARLKLPTLVAIEGLLVMLAAVFLSRAILAVMARGSMADPIALIFALLPRGEVTIVVLAAGLVGGLITQQIYLAGVIMVVVTSAISPVALSYRSGAADAGDG